MSAPVETANSKAAISGMSEEGETLLDSKVDKHHSHGTEVMASRAERLTSFSVEDFKIPSGFEEEWRFTPVKKLANLFSETPGEVAAVDYAIELPEGVVEGSLAIGQAPRGTALVPADRAAAVASADVAAAHYFGIPAGQELSEPLKLTITGQGEGLRANSHCVLEAGANSRAVVILDHHGSADFNGNLEIIVGEGAELTVVSVQRWEDTAKHLGQHDALIAKDAKYKHVAVTLGGAIVRLNVNARYAGEGAEAELFGLYFADAGQHLEHRTYIDHNVPNSKSNVLYKGALQGAQAHTVWVGDVLIQKQAVGTDSYEKNQNLILTDGARADSVPNLEIETGLIEGAGHASSTGRFDDEHLFYLMARGISERDARLLVVRGYLNEVIQKIKVPALEAELVEALERELEASGAL
ncbi:Fe-S cluster assembly protein SufD [Psychromicrobium silvestre]|uniref:Fe-S cluster assembly protein SufD n=1 Tax=Psychromicrobium silvestre TaxID=1645614 RepID=A0A7Y9LRD5_9MICC|nr:Fe-S cluster assembly protein SufD [Psychromicrobium silvestre]